MLIFHSSKKRMQNRKKENHQFFDEVWKMIGNKEFEKAKLRLQNMNCLYQFKHRLDYLNAIIDFYQQDFQNSLDRLESIEKPSLLADPFLLSFHEYKGYNLEKLQRYEEGIEAFSTAIEQKKEILPDHYIIYQHRGTCFLRIKNYANAISIYDKSLDLKADHNTYHNKAMAHFAINELKNALDSFDEAINLNNENSLFYLNRMQLLSKMENWDRVLEDSEVLLSRDQFTDSAFYYRGIALLEKGKFNQSIENLNEAYSLGYDKNQIYFYRGIANYITGNNKDSLKDFDQITDDNLKYKAKKKIEELK